MSGQQQNGEMSEDSNISRFVPQRIPTITTSIYRTPPQPQLHAEQQPQQQQQQKHPDSNGVRSTSPTPSAQPPQPPVRIRSSAAQRASGAAPVATFASSPTPTAASASGVTVNACLNTTDSMAALSISSPTPTLPPPAPQPPSLEGVRQAPPPPLRYQPAPPPPPPQSSTAAAAATATHQQLENATNVAARLVYKSAMLGSVQSLGINGVGLNGQQQQQATPTSTPLVANFGDNRQRHQHHHHQQQQQQQQQHQQQQQQVVTPQNIAAGALLRPESSFRSVLPWLLLNGEFIVNKDESDSVNCDIVFVMPDNRGLRGILYITNFRLYFRSEKHVSHHGHLTIDLPLALINRIEKIGHQSSKHSYFYGLLISCKDGRRLRFATTQEKGSRKQIYELLQRYAFPISNDLNYFAFSYRQSFSDNTGWQVYDAKQEYERMGISKSTDWRFTHINQSFKFCETYPKVLVVPQAISDEDLRQAGEFRSKHRIPVVSWLKYDSRKNHAALLRSSQPLVGLTNKRNEKDEAYLYTIYKINTINSLDKLFIVDARPFANAVANRANSGGYESDDNYRDCEIAFLNIHNIHVMRESLRKIYDMTLPPAATQQQQQQQQSSASGQSHASVTNSNSNSNSTGSSHHHHHHRSTSHGGGSVDTNAASSGLSTITAAAAAAATATVITSYDDKNFFLNLENSKWLEHVRSVLNGALRIVKYIHDHSSSVLVHCSDGWDRTAQLTSLAMLMMDKHYRTLRGFQVLVEKEWISFGHRFGVRMGHGTDKHSDQDRSPIFLQFVDCVWQLQQQNTRVFEFNEAFLLAVVNNMYTCQFGTFLYNNECEREKSEVRQRTVSFWSYVNSYRNEFRNHAYVEHDGVVELSTAPSALQLWTAYYFQYKDNLDDSAAAASGNGTAEQLVVHRRAPLLTGAGGAAGGAIAAASYTVTPPMPPRVFGQAFFQQMVSQMKSSVKNYTPQEPELIRYRASVQHSDICN